MSTALPAILALNRGLLSPLGQARTDLKRQAMSAEVQTNLMPRVLGSAMLRPGLGHVGATRGNLRAKFLPFVFSTTDVALLEFTVGALRVWLPGTGAAPDTLLTRPAVTAAITNGTFDTDLTGWTDADESGATSAWDAGTMKLSGTGYNSAIRYQTVTCNEPGVEHALRIVVPIAGTVVRLNIGTVAGDGTYAFNLDLEEGTHSIAFTPTGNFVVQFSNAYTMPAYVESVAVEAAGVVELTTPFTEDMLSLLRHDQSASVVYLACDGVQQQKVLRWGRSGEDGERSFSIVYYAPLDGPFGLQNTGPTTIAASATTGAVTLTASRALFRSGHVGGLFRMASNSQNALATVGGLNQYTAPIEVTGLNTNGERTFGIYVTGTFVGTVVLQRSIGAVGAWEDVPGQQWTAPVATTYDDALDNQVIFYRLGFEGAYTSGSADCKLYFAQGAITGIVRITGVSSPTVASAFVIELPGNTGTLRGLGSTDATNSWWEGLWSSAKGFPTSVALAEGRLWWAGRNWVIGSVSDAYESFDDTVEGDSGPIIRTIGSGPVDVINWILPLQRVLLGAQGAEKSIASSTGTGPLTPTDFNMKNADGQGSAAMAAVAVDDNGVFVQRSGRRVYELAYKPNFFGKDYAESDLTNFVPDLAVAEQGEPLDSPGIAMIAVQRQPDTRIHAVLNDGTVRVLIYDPTEEEKAWIKVETDGIVEDVCVLPGQAGATAAEDLVHYVVRRTINGATVRYLERWALEEECWGGDVCKLADSFVTGTNAFAVAEIAGLGHLVGETVVIWGGGADLGTGTVDANGKVTLAAEFQGNWMAGLAYRGRFKSTKLAYAAQLGSPLNQKKRIAALGVMLANAHSQGLRYGRDFDNLFDLPMTYRGKPSTEDVVRTSYDDGQFGFPGEWSTDARLCLEAAAPRPVTILGVTMLMETRERT